MATQTQKDHRSSSKAHEEPQTRPSTAMAKQGEELKDKLDGLLEEIDGALEENAEEFVRGYIQHGGQ